MDEKTLNDHLIIYIAEQYVRHDEEEKKLKHLILHMHVQYVENLMACHSTITILNDRLVEQNKKIIEQSKVIQKLKQKRNQNRIKPYN